MNRKSNVAVHHEPSVAASGALSLGITSELAAAKEKAQQEEQRAVVAEAELREARHALRELALQLPVCERLVADLRADSAPSSEMVTEGAGATGPALSKREAELEHQLAEVSACATI